MIFVILMMGLVLVAAAAVVLLLYLANRAAKKPPAPLPPDGVGAAAPGPAKPEEPKTIEGHEWNGRFVRVEFERDPIAGGLIDERPSVEGTTLVYKKLYLKGTPNCTNQYDAQARMVPEKPDEPEFLVYYKGDSVFIARRDCLDTQSTSYRYLAAASKTEIEGDSEQTGEGRESVRERNTSIGIKLFFSADPFEWSVAAHDVPEKTMSLSPLYDPDLFVGVEKKIVASKDGPHEFLVFLTLGKASYLYDRFKVRFSE